MSEPMLIRDVVIGPGESHTVRLPIAVTTGPVEGRGPVLVVDDDPTVGRALARRLTGASEIPGRHRALNGIEFLSKMVVIDQTPPPPPRTPLG